LFGCNEYIDLNRNGHIEENEFINKKDTFRLEEPIMLVGNFRGYTGDLNIQLKVSRVSDNHIFIQSNWAKETIRLGEGYWSRTEWNLSANDRTKFNDNDLLAADWSIDGSSVGKYYFTVKK